MHTYTIRKNNSFYLEFFLLNFQKHKIYTENSVKFPTTYIPRPITMSEWELSVFPKQNLGGGGVIV